MAQRIKTAIILLAVFIPLLIFSDNIVFAVIISMLSLIGAYEMLKCLGVHKNAAIVLPSLVLAAAAPLLARLMPKSESFSSWAASVLFIYMFWLCAYCVIKRGNTSFSLVAAVFTAIAYITYGFTSLILLRDSDGGEYVFWLVFVGAWITDTMAYFTGLFFGRHKLIPEISPKKTVEGALGGTLFAALSFVAYGLIVERITGVAMRMLPLFAAGLVAAITAQFGDLIASLIKRERGIKDYGNIFPGHGGILDRFDSIIALAPFILFLHGAPFLNLIK